MPYADRTRQLEAMREWRRRRKLEREQGQAPTRGQSERERQGPAFGRAPAAASSSPARSAPRAEQSAPYRELLSPAIAQRRRSDTRTRPAPERRASPERPTPAASSSPRRQLLLDYQRERAAGRDDAAAQAATLHAQAERTARAAIEREEREVLQLAPQFVAEARRRLSMGGFYNELDVWPAAAQLARQELRHRQAPRHGDTPRSLLAPRRVFQIERGE